MAQRVVRFTLRSLSTSAIIWKDPEAALAEFDSLVPELGGRGSARHPWERLLAPVPRRAPARIRGPASQAERIVLAPDGVRGRHRLVSAGRMARPLRWPFQLMLSPELTRGCSNPELSHADRAFLYAVKSAALQLGGCRRGTRRLGRDGGLRDL